MIGKDDAFAVEKDLRKEIFAAVESEGMTKAAAMVLGDVLDDGGTANPMAIRQVKQVQVVLTGAVDTTAEQLGGLVEDDLVEIIGAMVDPREAIGQTAAKLEIQCPQEQGQLFRVGIGMDVPVPLFDDLKIGPVIRLECLMSHRAALWGNAAPTKRIIWSVGSTWSVVRAIQQPEKLLIAFPV